MRKRIKTTSRRVCTYRVPPRKTSICGRGQGLCNSHVLIIAFSITSDVSKLGPAREAIKDKEKTPVLPTDEHTVSFVI